MYLDLDVGGNSTIFNNFSVSGDSSFPRPPVIVKAVEYFPTFNIFSSPSNEQLLNKFMIQIQ